MRIRQTHLPLALLALAFLSACKEAPQIGSQRVPKDQSGIEDFRGGNRAPTSAPVATSKNFVAPKGWTRGKSSPMFPSDKFIKSFGEHEVTLSIMPLPASNGWLANVTRWAGQVDLQKSAEEIEAMTEQVEVDGIASQRVHLIGGKNSDDAIIGIMATQGAKAWFIKLTGNESAISDAEDEFDEYVKTLKIP